MLKITFARKFCIVLLTALAAVSALKIVRFLIDKYRYADSPQIRLAFQAFQRVDEIAPELKFLEVSCSSLERSSYQCSTKGALSDQHFVFRSELQVPHFSFRAERHLDSDFLLIEFPSMENAVSYEDVMKLNQIFDKSIFENRRSD